MTRGCASRLLILSANGSFWKWVGGIGTGLMIAVGWGSAHLVSANSFQVVQVQGLTFSGPSAKWLMRVLSSPAPAIGFDFDDGAVKRQQAARVYPQAMASNLMQI